jgi:hypothetical protein
MPLVPFLIIEKHDALEALTSPLEGNQKERDVLAGRLRVRLLVEQQLEVHDVIA